MCTSPPPPCTPAHEVLPPAASASPASAPTSATYASTTTANPFTRATADQAASLVPN